MDPTAAADSSGMASLLRFVAVAASAIVIVSFLAFANEEAGRGSRTQVDKLGEALDEPAPAPNVERVREHRHSRAHELVDDINDVLLRPFEGLLDSRNPWVQRIVPGLLALLVYGLGLALLANVLPRKAPVSRDWRTAA
jgi:hypothetical protein